MRGIVKSKDSGGQVALTWLLYFLLDIITMLVTTKSLIKAGGFQILFGSAIVSLLMFIILLRKKKIIWTWFETGIVILIFICISIWFTKGPYEAVIWGIISESIVGVYLLVKTIKLPVVEYNLLGYTFFLLACIIAVLDAPDWSLHEIGYPASEVIITLFTIIPLLVKWYGNKKRNGLRL